MRKYMIGILIGFALSFAVGAHAEVASMIGKAIDGEFPVKVNGVGLSNKAIVVEGTSYLPVRSFGEATGYDVSFNADLGIELKAKEPAKEVQQSMTTQTQTTEPSGGYPLSKIQGEISRLTTTIQSYTGFIELHPDNPATPGYKTDLGNFKQELDFWNSELAKWQAANPTPTP